MKTFLFFVLVACSIILIDCTSTEGTLTFEGKVIDEYSKECIPKRIVIIQGMTTSDSQSTLANESGRFTTDSSGHFKYTLNKIKNINWYNFTFVGDDTYSYSTRIMNLWQLEHNSKSLSFYLEKLTDLTIKIERINKTIPRDTLFVSWRTNGIDGKTYQSHVINYGIPPDMEYRWIGGNVKSLIETKTFANKNTIVRMHLFRNGKVKEMSDTIFCERDIKNYFTFKY